MARGRDTSTFRIEKKTREELINGCSHPALLREIFERSRDLAFGRGTVAEFNFFCRQQPCILWSPEDQKEWSVNVRITHEIDPALVRVSRVVWAVVNTVAAQGPLLRGDEELHHECGNNGHGNTGIGTCLNPGHMIRGTQETRRNLKIARRLLRTVGSGDHLIKGVTA